MNWFIRSALTFVLFLVFTSAASAHGSGPPFFKVNGNILPQYSVTYTSLSNFVLPQDIAPDRYLVNEPIKFEIDKKLMEIPQEVLKDIQFNWDYGDGEKASGTTNTHTYTKIGSYILSITTGNSSEKQSVIESTLIHILPNKEYILPVATIFAQGQKTNDPNSNFIRTDFTKPIVFDSSHAFSGTGKIASYRWDFGDGKESAEANPIHNYAPSFDRVYPVLRITNVDGFIADTFVELFNKPETGGAEPSSVASPSATNVASYQLQPQLAPVVIVLVVVLGLVIYFFIFMKKR